MLLFIVLVVLFSVDIKQISNHSQTFEDPERRVGRIGEEEAFVSSVQCHEKTIDYLLMSRSNIRTKKLSLIM